MRVIAKIINDLGFDDVAVLDVHSTIAVTLIDRCVTVVPELIDDEPRFKSVLIYPDYGAMGRYNPGGYIDVVCCTKNRDPDNGRISLALPDPVKLAGKLAGKNVVIIDDICDGGATFIAIAEQLPSDVGDKVLAVTHGLFSKGLEKLLRAFDRIITTNSVNELIADRLTVVDYMPFFMETK